MATNSPIPTPTPIELFKHAEFATYIGIGVLLSALIVGLSYIVKHYLDKYTINENYSYETNINFLNRMQQNTYYLLHITITSLFLGIVLVIAVFLMAGGIIASSVGIPIVTSILGYITANKVNDIAKDIINKNNSDEFSNNNQRSISDGASGTTTTL